MDKKYTLVDNPADWSVCLNSLETVSRMAVDLEANSLYSYRERICLIQIATAEEIFIIDPLSESFDLAPLKNLLANPAVEKVFHAAEYDLMLLKSRYGWDVHNLFDTIVAARVLGLKQLGLASLLEQLLEVRIDKKYQRADWGKRPLRPDYLAYAADDTRFLLALRDLLEQRLRESGCWREAQSLFHAATLVHPVQREFDPDRYRRLAGAFQLSPRGQAVLRELYIFRDQEARKRDMPPFKVINDDILVRLADLTARDAAIPEQETVFRKLQARFGGRLTMVLRQGLENPLPARSRRIRSVTAQLSGNGFTARMDALLSWRKKKARERGVESDVILSRRAARAISEHNPDSLEALRNIAAVGSYTVEAYGPEILQILSKVPNHMPAPLTAGEGRNIHE